MVNKITLNEVYNITPDNLSRIPNPLFNDRYMRFLTDREMVGRAKKVVAMIERNQPDLILYSDTGAWPLSYICQELIKNLPIGSKLRNVKWRAIKCPRELAGKYESVILSLLNADERREREKLIRKNSVALNEHFSEKARTPLRKILGEIKKARPVHVFFEKILSGTEFAELLKGNVVYLDEYVDSGVTLSNTFNVLKCFNARIRANIVAYHIFAKQKDLDSDLVSSLFTNDDGVNAFLPGAYPYENRVDIIGKYYVSSKTGLKLVAIDSLPQKNKRLMGKIRAISKFLIDCQVFISNHKLETLVESQVVDKYEVLRYLLYAFEKSSSRNMVVSELLWNLFDMHGPAWSPLPNSYHFDFWNDFERLKKELMKLDEFEILKRRYKKLEKEIVQAVVGICNKKNRKWKQTINRLIIESK